MTQCEAVYGETGAVGLATSTLPSENLEVDKILSEDDIDAMYAGEFCTSEPAEVPPLNHTTSMNAPSLYPEDTVDDLICSTDPAEAPSLNYGTATLDAPSLEQEDPVDDLILHLDMDPSDEGYYAGN